MSLLGSRIWSSGIACTGLSVEELDLKLKLGRFDGYVRADFIVPGLRDEKVATNCIHLGVRSRPRPNADLAAHRFTTGTLNSWERRGLRRDLGNGEVERSGFELEEDELFSVTAGSGDDDEVDDGNEFRRTGSRRHAVRRGRRAALLVAGSVVFLNSACLCCSKAEAEEWDYGKPSGVKKWQGLCAAGPKQSPIDIPLSKAKRGENQGELIFEYVSSRPTIMNPGHGTMQVTFPHGENVLRVGGRTLELLQFHFHAPSEHAFNGDRFDMEAHLVHRDVLSKRLAVVGIMLDASKSALPNKVLAESLAYAPAEHDRSIHVQNVTFSPSLLLPPTAKKGKKGSRGYIHYIGSLSTPPCSEGVDWFILEKAVEISTSQVLDFMKFAGDGHSLAFNSRPLQPLGDRAVFEGP
ncbi:hypothetical protein MPTK1_4g18060 [Marchantia polymorpha subsp. ruderalis]|uniref:carbonic anhydrase n=2 Tax=Marchantia polymorpha TaxID=3197 RepID=A0AAF6BB46_MARPO|nr:hypothetical protein MARPO_0041s0087 [Marchantia polymorpha]BBN09230.1 hypothetical protein Mp_4g18060 [Marchantia polymorpha subsp. ruderalis]|eukprot:PTQ40218.1 hypothetical protein MARPO_0041s0087 [Marchantia polymorpha]